MTESTSAPYNCPNCNSENVIAADPYWSQSDIFDWTATSVVTCENCAHEYEIKLVIEPQKPKCAIQWTKVNHPGLVGSRYWECSTCGYRGDHDSHPGGRKPDTNKPLAVIESVSDRYGNHFTHVDAKLRVYNGYVPAVGDTVILSDIKV